MQIGGRASANEWIESRQPKAVKIPGTEIKIVQLLPALRAKEIQFVVYRPTAYVATLLRGALAESQHDWRTIDSLASELDVSVRDIELALIELGSEVRRPVGARGKELGYLRLSRLGKTRKEWIRIVRSSLTRMPL
ncbi:hypothetical protein CH278_19660 [Rhodococcus sp. 05-2254-5]|nr:hypothetical protein CH278_19660 [Rhodococcus sp. 05-2254-5]OZE53782.1 hypothetical protein CH269_21965 [Rhodococcus sp. 05-2254-1]